MRPRLLLAVLTLLPQIALAASPSTLADLATVIRNQTGPYALSAEMHAHVPGMFYVSAWMKGDSEKTGPLSSKGNLKTTVDLSDGTLTGRIRGRLRVDGTTLYMILDSLEGTFPEEARSAQGRVPVGQWFKATMPVEESDLQESLRMQTDLLTGLEELLDTTRTETAGGTEYTVSLKPEAQMQLAALVRMLTSSLQTELQKKGIGSSALLPHTMPAVTVKARVRLGASNTLLLFRQYVAAEDPPVLRFALQSEQVPSNVPVTVEIPAGAIDLSSELPANLAPAPAGSRSSLETDCSVTGAAKLALIRKGLCQDSRPSRRR